MVPLSVRKPLAASKQSSALLGIYALTSSGGWASSDEGGASSMRSLMMELLRSSSGVLTFTLIVATEDVLASPVSGPHVTVKYMYILMSIKNH